MSELTKLEKEGYSDANKHFISEEIKNKENDTSQSLEYELYRLLLCEYTRGIKYPSNIGNEKIYLLNDYISQQAYNFIATSYHQLDKTDYSYKYLHEGSCKYIFNDYNSRSNKCEVTISQKEITLQDLSSKVIHIVQDNKYDCWVRTGYSFCHRIKDDKKKTFLVVRSEFSQGDDVKSVYVSASPTLLKKLYRQL